MGCTTGLEYVKIFVIGNINQCYNAAGAARTNNFFNLKLKSERGKSMKKYTKFAGILLALVMLVALIPMMALADTPTYPPNTDAPGTMNLVIMKRASGLDETKEYTFNFKYYQIEDPSVSNWEIKPIENDVKGEFFIIVKWNNGIHTGEYTIENLPQNIWIAVEEIDPVIPEGYRLTTKNIEKIYTDPVAGSPKYIDNNYKKRTECDIVISKTVEGSGANANDEFEFEITFYLPKEEQEPPDMSSVNNAAPMNVPPAIGKAYPRIYKTLADGRIYDFEDEDYDAFPVDGRDKVTGRFKLKHGESLTILNAAAKYKPIKVKELDSKGYLTTVNGIMGTQWEEEEPVADTIRVNFINTKESLPLSESLSVEKRWSDGNEKHMRDSVTVQLYRNGEPYSFTMFGRVVDDGRVELSAANRWQHTWSGLDAGYKWTVAELNVPKGYVSTVNYYGGSAIITNTAVSAGLPQTGDAQMPYIGAGLVLAAMAIVVIIAGKKRN